MTVLDPSMVCKLGKFLYGLKQASRQWYSKLSDALYSRGYIVSRNDYSLFLKHSSSSIVIVAVYVDDVLVTGNDTTEITSLKSFLDQQFRIKDLGILHYFLGLEVLRESAGVIITQRKFVVDMLTEFDSHDLSPVSAPLHVPCKITSNTRNPLSNPLVYCRLVGKLNFLTNTRPDLSYSVQLLSQFMHSPCEGHFQAALHVLRYVKGTVGQGLFMSTTSDFKLHAFCDRDWAACPESRRSISGFIVLLGSSLLCWKSKKQPTVSLSSTKAEYRSMRRVVAELAWLSR
ncbi:uncharacterized mitochondrial protein AtMg00810-like [Nicotiana sylvestris]|uniref:uncharacterized mitochondrial protein AtMg00810-like n=1 Tax=Nicotiana sylvestris TaxID=4096 RepID=UPI00388CCFB4